MSAMSELKLQQAVLERENLELRASHFNNNTIAADRRLPPVPNARIRTNSSSGSMVIATRYFISSYLLINYLPCLYFFHRLRHQRSVVKWTFTTTVFRVHRPQTHQRPSNRVAVQQIIPASIQMQIQNEMQLHSVNSL